MRIIVAIALAGLCAGCVTNETVQFRAAADQQAVTRDGNPGIVSTKKHSTVIARPAARQFQSGGRPVFVLAIFNQNNRPEDFKISNVKVTQTVNDTTVPIEVITYEKLVQEERNAQIAMAIVGGLAAGANAYSASRAGYYNANSTVYTPRGTFQVHTTGYDPTAAAIAQSNAAAQNAAMTAAIVENGQRNLAGLEQTVIKDNTLMPGEWYGGRLYLAPLEGTDSSKTYTISVSIGSERHDISIVQGPPGGKGTS